MPEVHAVGDELGGHMVLEVRAHVDEDPVEVLRITNTVRNIRPSTSPDVPEAVDAMVLLPRIDRRRRGRGTRICLGCRLGRRRSWMGWLRWRGLRMLPRLGAARATMSSDPRCTDGPVVGESLRTR